MQKAHLFCLLVLAIIFGSCKKEVAVETYSYARIKVIYKNFAQAPDIKIEANATTLGTMKVLPQVPFEGLIMKTSERVSLRIKRLSNDSLLLDTAFVPARENVFTVFITDLLNVAAFYTPPATPVSPDSNRLQLLNNVKVQGVGVKVNFRFFAPLTTTLTSFEELPQYAVNNVEYGKISAPVDIPKMKYPTGQVQTVLRPIYIKTYDAVTGTLLVDLKTGTTNNTYGNVIATGVYTAATSGGKFNIINVNTTESGGVVSYVRPFPSYAM
ncbi:MAG: hypothetical protein QM731_26340 [Chitinophagaceae bacterium]